MYVLLVLTLQKFTALKGVIAPTSQKALYFGLLCGMIVM